MYNPGNYLAPYLVALVALALSNLTLLIFTMVLVDIQRPNRKSAQGPGGW